jgi:Family of unknown function (DUF1028)
MERVAEPVAETATFRCRAQRSLARSEWPFPFCVAASRSARCGDRRRCSKIRFDAALAADGQGRPRVTFSIIARCERTGMFGIGIATRPMAIGAKCLWSANTRSALL